MKRLLSLSLILALFAGVGCDSNDDDDPTDAEIFVGTWSVAEIRNNADGSDATSPTNQDITQFIFGNTGSVKDGGFVFTFSGNGRYTLLVDYKDPNTEDVDIQGTPFTYTVAPSSSEAGQGTLTLMVPLNETTLVPATAQYEITSETEMTATIPAQLMNEIFGTTLYKGRVAVVFAKQ